MLEAAGHGEDTVELLSQLIKCHQSSENVVFWAWCRLGRVSSSIFVRRAGKVASDVVVVADSDSALLFELRWPG